MPHGSTFPSISRIRTSKTLPSLEKAWRQASNRPKNKLIWQVRGSEDRLLEDKTGRQPGLGFNTSLLKFLSKGTGQVLDAAARKAGTLPVLARRRRRPRHSPIIRAEVREEGEHSV
jgi:hypothetical protein